MNIQTSKKILYTYNLTEFSNAKLFYPKNIDEIKYLLNQKKKFLIKTGGCGHGDKSSLKGNANIISLKKFNRINKIDKKKMTLTAEAGIYLLDITRTLKSEGFYIFNVPGGQQVSLGGAISGNVHGRLSNKKFANFGDNLISIKIIDNSRKIRKITSKNKLFYKIVGGQGYYGLIIEATLKIQRIKDYFFYENYHQILNLGEFYEFEKKNKKYYGYINYFNSEFEFNVSTLSKTFKNKKNKTFYNLKDKKIPSFAKLFVGKLSLKILYFYLFRLKRYLIFKRKKISIEKAIYVSNYISNLPKFFRSGFLELQFSVKYQNLIKLIEELKKLIKLSKIYPIFFILKKLDKSSKNYFFNFPKFNHSISLGFSKEEFINNKNFFKKFYKVLEKNNCNIYVTKDEIFTIFQMDKYRNIFKSYYQKSSYNTSNFLKKFI
jgi:decaprenylphospho-beta-D-ribofuranose 2-oxidase|tara:strand:+ start:1669 stop:2967 length:1299 start_codon:yes stop_codon:yes gene_type:complete